jgi:hypothetical protein
MNERIQELINQSWQNVEGAPREGMEDIRQALMEELNPVFLEFAKLLLQECLLSISKTKLFTEEEFAVMIKCHNQVEKHFGVEE